MRLESATADDLVYGLTRVQWRAVES
jgi:hypothetical protein